MGFEKQRQLLFQQLADQGTDSPFRAPWQSEINNIGRMYGLAFVQESFYKRFCVKIINFNFDLILSFY
jgi:hypothetical protein